MTFIGQKAIIDSFMEHIKNHTLGHAYAFTGPEGAGKKTLARYIAKMILCTNSEDMPCGYCRSCKSFDLEGNPGFTVIRSETQRILISQIRELIDNINIKPAYGRKVYLIEEADRMTVEAQNCLLKTLEEPPQYAVILMTTAYYDSLVATIRSRVVQTKLKPYTFEELNQILQLEGLDMSGKEYVYELSSGIPGKAGKLINDGEIEELRDKVMDFVFDSKEFSALDLNLYLSNNKEAFSECMDILLSVLRDALIACYGVHDGLINNDKKDKILEYANGLKPYEIIEKINNIQDIRSALKRNMNYQLAVDMVTLGT
ncbi:MAG: AAA family ATPase [Clostridiaceae bacterium]|nr:AAA family ATPase [Clostridiaceae bacterium]